LRFFLRVPSAWCLGLEPALVASAGGEIANHCTWEDDE